MEKEIKSEFVFSLADKYGIPLTRDIPVELSDETYANFCNEYVQLAKSRDLELSNYFIANPKLFRTFLPWRQNVFHTAFQLQWYYDEIVIYDPIYFEITHFKTGDLEEDKDKLRDLLSFLDFFKESISSGFILFAGYDSFGNQEIKESTNKVFKDLIKIPEIRNELDKLVYISKKEKINENEITNLTIRTYYRGQHSFLPVIQKPDNPTPNKDGHFTWTIDLMGDSYHQISVEEVIQLGIYDKLFENFDIRYQREISETFNYLNLGQTINAPTLFDRKLDELIIKESSLSNQPAEIRPDNYYNLSLPFVRGIPPERLLEIRTNMPNAFLDFRNTMFEIIYDLQRAGLDSSLLEARIQQRVNPILRKLETEIQNSLLKAKLLGLGVPLVSGLGTWGLWQYGFDARSLEGLIMGGISVSAELKVLTDRLTERNTIKANPLYYLWKVLQTK